MTFRQKTLTLHIGGEKTGSTSIQRSLALSSRDLAVRHRILYPTTSPLFLPSGHYPILSVFLPASDLDFVRKAKRIDRPKLRSALAALPAGGIDEILLSAEHLSSRMRLPQIREFRDIIAAALPDHRIRIIYHVRSQTTLFCAGVSTYIKGFGITHESAADTTTDARYLNHYAVASDWAEVFGDDAMLIKNFHAGDALRLFYTSLGIDAESARIRRPAWRNLSLSREEAAILTDINAAFGEADFSQETLIRTRRWVQHMLIVHLRVALPRRTPFAAMLTPADRQHLRREFADSNDRLQARFSLDFNLNEFMLKGEPPPASSSVDPLADPAVERERARWLAVIGAPPRSLLEKQAAANRMQRVLARILLRRYVMGAGRWHERRRRQA